MAGREIWLFPDQTDDFTYDHRTWKCSKPFGQVLDERTLQVVERHRLEAIRRKVMCRFEDRAKEAGHWHAQLMFLTNLFNLPPIEEIE